jgi:alpha-galactosidase
MSLENGRALAQVKPAILNDLPMRIIRTAGQEKVYEKIIHLAGQLINLYKANVKNQKLVQHRIDYLKEEINDKVYELYSLNKKDIEIIKKAIE